MAEFDDDQIQQFIQNWFCSETDQSANTAAACWEMLLSLANTRAPDVSFVRAERLPRSPQDYATIPPDLMVEVKSPTDEIEELRNKIDEFLAQGTVVGILVNPDDRTLEIRRLNQAVVVLRDGDVLTVPDLLPGWEVPVSALWSPVFE